MIIPVTLVDSDFNYEFDSGHTLIMFVTLINSVSNANSEFNFGYTLFLLVTD
jgi:hypothetical protein